MTSEGSKACPFSRDSFLILATTRQKSTLVIDAGRTYPGDGLVKVGTWSGRRSSLHIFQIKRPLMMVQPFGQASIRKVDVQAVFSLRRRTSLNEVNKLVGGLLLRVVVD